MAKRVLKLEDLTVEQKIGQVLIARGFGPGSPENVDFILEMVKKKAVGGIQIGPSDFGLEKIREIQEMAEYPVLICCDMENGYPASPDKVPSQIAMAAADDEEMVYENAYLTACEAKKHGFNTIWSPVVDTCRREKLCGTARAFGDDFETVARFSKAATKGYQDAHVITAAKHYPSPWDVNEDTHMRTVPSLLTREELIRTSLRPYIEIMKEMPLSGIMTNHVEMKNIEPGLEATVSPKVLSIIRELGFEGVIFTDSLAMMSMVQKYGEAGCVVKAFVAGCDLILPSYRLDYKTAYDSMLQAYREGIITDARLDESVARVLAAQEKTIPQPPVEGVEEKHRDLIARLIEKSLHFSGRDGAQSALPADSKKVFILTCENAYPGYDAPIQDEISAPDSFTRHHMEQYRERILQAFPGSRVEIISAYPCWQENELALRAAAEADETVFVTFSKPMAYAGNDGITDRMEYLISCCGDHVTVFHVGNPYELGKMKTARRLFLGHLGGDYLDLFIRALKGEFVPTGKLPVKLD